MADNTLQTGSANIATDDLVTINGGAVSGVMVQRVKAGYGVDSDFKDVTAVAGLPVAATQAGTGTITSPAIGSTSAPILAANANRKQAVFYNGTNVDVLLSVSASAATAAAFSVRMLAGGYYELPGDTMVYVGALTGVGVAPGTLTLTASSSGAFTVTELTP